VERNPTKLRTTPQDLEQLIRFFSEGVDDTVPDHIPLEKKRKVFA